jgi:putative toxin-antitoxin system antitoxin component (TIGR02293 family)
MAYSVDSSFSVLHSLSPIERSQVIEAGVPAALLTRLADKLSISKERLCATLGVSRATVDRALKAHRNLSSADSEHVVGLARLIGQVEQIVQESGNPEGFDAGLWVAEFIEAENPALGGRRPAELMRTSDGRAVVSTLIAQMQSGAYA